MSATILVADDDRTIRTVLERSLAREGFDVQATGNGSTLWSWVEKGEGDLVITDVVMPGEDGLDLVPRIREIRPDLRVIVISAQTTLHTAVEANRRGAYEYLPKPFDLTEVIGVVNRALSGGPEVVVDHGYESGEQLPLIGRSPAMQDIYRVLARLMSTDLTVMITGESGTGKELAARALHDYGKRRNGPFVAINMAAIPRELIEAELFGHERGAFTGATSRKAGRFEQAQRGSLFLDEIGDMPIEAQTRLLRVLQDGEYTTVGGRNMIKADVRIIAATHRNLGQLVRRGTFREDLYYRLNVVPVRMPPLRERSDDIPELVSHFFAREAASGLPVKALDRGAMAAMLEYQWPGNVRELENLVRRLAVLYSETMLTGDVVRRELEGSNRDHLEPGASGESLSETIEAFLVRDFDQGKRLPKRGLYNQVLREMELPLLKLTLAATEGNQIRAAEILGLNRNTLRKKIRYLGIEVTRESKGRYR